MFTNAIKDLAKVLKGNKSSGSKEFRLVDFPKFKGGSQDPIAWLEGFEEACAANNIKQKRMLQIAKACIKGEAQSWLKNSKIKSWNDKDRITTSFIHQFKKDTVVISQELFGEVN